MCIPVALINHARVEKRASLPRFSFVAHALVPAYLDLALDQRVPIYGRPCIVVPKNNWPVSIVIQKAHVFPPSFDYSPHDRL